MSILFPHKQKRHLTQVWTLKKPHLPQPPHTPSPGSRVLDLELSVYSSGSIQTQDQSVSPCQDLC